MAVAALSAAFVGLALACEPPGTLFDTSAISASVGTGTPESCTEESLRRALATQPVVTFDCGPAAATITIERTLVIATDRDTVIDGHNRITLDGRHRARLLSLTDAGYRSNRHRLTLQRIRLVNGRAAGTGYVAPDLARPRCASGFSGGNGGAIEVRNARLDVIEAVFENNAAASPGPDVGGGAIYAAGSLGVGIVASRFLANSGANGGAVGLLQSNGSVVDSRFESNQAIGTGRNDAAADVAGCPGVGHAGQGGAGGNGGAIAVDGSDDGDLVVCGSTFIGNRANELAGAIFRTSNAAPRRTVIDRSVFAENRAAQGGAAFIMNSSSLEIAASNFTGNVAQIAGAAHFADATLALRDSVFAGNQATLGAAGALMLSGTGTASTFRKVTFARNRAVVSGGRFGASIYGDTDFEITDSVRCDDSSGTPATTGLRQGVGEAPGLCVVAPMDASSRFRGKRRDDRIGQHVPRSPSGPRRPRFRPRRHAFRNAPCAEESGQCAFSD